MLKVLTYVTGEKYYLKIMTAMSAPFDFEKSNMISSAIFLAFPYGLIGNQAKVRHKPISTGATCLFAQVPKIIKRMKERTQHLDSNLKLFVSVTSQLNNILTQNMVLLEDISNSQQNYLRCGFCNRHLLWFSVGSTCTGVDEGFDSMRCHSLQNQ